MDRRLRRAHYGKAHAAGQRLDEYLERKWLDHDTRRTINGLALEQAQAYGEAESTRKEAEGALFAKLQRSAVEMARAAGAALSGRVVNLSPADVEKMVTRGPVTVRSPYVGEAPDAWATGAFDAWWANR